MQICIPFKERFREPMLNGTKTMTTRTKIYGGIGDWFNVFGATFALTSVDAVPFKIIRLQWKAEGCNSEEDFLAVWKEIHPRHNPAPFELFYVHRFQNITKKPEPYTYEQFQKEIAVPA